MEYFKTPGIYRVEVQRCYTTNEYCLVELQNLNALGFGNIVGWAQKVSIYPGQRNVHEFLRVALISVGEREKAKRIDGDLVEHCFSSVNPLKRAVLDAHVKEVRTKRGARMIQVQFAQPSLINRCREKYFHQGGMGILPCERAAGHSGMHLSQGWVWEGNLEAHRVEESVKKIEESANKIGEFKFALGRSGIHERIIPAKDNERYAFFCGLYMGDFDPKIQKEYLRIMREWGEALGDKK